MTVEICRTCAHAVPVVSRNWPDATNATHCALGHPRMRSFPVNAWIISADGPCQHRPERWSPRRAAA